MKCHLLHEAVSGSSCDYYLDPSDFVVAVVLRYCPCSLSVGSDPDTELVKTQEHMLMALSFHPVLHPVTFYQKSHQEGKHLTVVACFHSGVWVAGGMNLGHEQRAAVASAV